MSTEEEETTAGEEPAAMEWQGEHVYARALKLTGSKIDMGDRLTLPRRSTFGAVLRARVAKVGIEDQAGAATLLHTATAEQAVLVSEELVADVLAAAREEETGQLQLLTPEGELRHAANAARRLRAEQVETEGFDPLGGGIDYEGLCADASAAIDQCAELDADKTGADEYWSTLVELATEATARTMALIQEARAGQERHLANRRAELDAERERHAAADESGNVPTGDDQIDGDAELDAAVAASKTETDDRPDPENEPPPTVNPDEYCAECDREFVSPRGKNQHDARVHA